MRASEASEEGDLHIRDDGSSTDDQTLDTRQFVGVYVYKSLGAADSIALQ